MKKNKHWGQNPKNEVNFDLLDFHNPKNIWNKKIPEWRKNQEKLKTLHLLKEKGWPFQWFASWNLNKFQEPIAEKIYQHLEVIHWYYRILIKDNKNELKIGKLKLKITELDYPKKILISISSPIGEFNPLEIDHENKVETIHLIYTEKPSEIRLLGDIILSPFRKKINPQQWEKESPHTPWDLLK